MYDELVWTLNSQDYSSHRNFFPLFWATRASNFRSGDMHKKAGSTGMITKILTFDLAVKETRIFQSQISAFSNF